MLMAASVGLRDSVASSTLSDGYLRLREGVMAIEVGAEAPDFVLKDENNQEVRLS